MKMVNLRKRLFGMGIGILAMLSGGSKTELEVRASEPPAISELKVAVSDDGAGIVAQCGYQNYDSQAGCEMNLYLYKVEESGRLTILKRKKLSFAVSGNECTDAYEAEEGTFLAAVMMDYGDKMYQTKSQYYYKVKIVDGKTEITETTDREQEGQQEAQTHFAKVRFEENTGASCQHILESELVRQATACQDSMMAYQCSICGEVVDYVEVANSAYAAFLRETVYAINNAKEEKITIRTDRWLSFNQEVLDALAARRNVEVTVEYQYQGEKYSVTVPVGAEVRSLADENGFCGFLYLSQVFGGAKIEG